MQGLSDESRKKVLGEVLADELKAIRELVQDVPLIKQKVDKLENDVAELKDDMQAVKSVIRLHDREIKQLQSLEFK